MGDGTRQLILTNFAFALIAFMEEKILGGNGDPPFSVISPHPFHFMYKSDSLIWNILSFNKVKSLLKYSKIKK